MVAEKHGEALFPCRIGAASLLFLKVTGSLMPPSNSRIRICSLTDFLHKTKFETHCLGHLESEAMAFFFIL
jgi:hypothetical protein